jgi:UPF0042 nucleotide-binding protein
MNQSAHEVPPEEKQKIRLVVVSGLAGSGKTVAIHALEDLGYYCVDNLPAALMSSFVDLIEKGLIEADHVGLALDSRDPETPQVFHSHAQKLRSLTDLELLFLEAQEGVVLKRFRETRRLHPLSRQAGTSQFPLPLQHAIKLDAQVLAPMKALSSRVVDTTEMTSHYLRQLMRHYFSPHTTTDDLVVNLISFGFKYGIPQDIDTLFDVRCFPNPHYDETLRPLTGLHPDVKNFVFRENKVTEFLKRTSELLKFLYPLYRTEGKHYFGVGIGCTGGKHRSVAIVEELAKSLKPELPCVTVEHRHFDRE